MRCKISPYFNFWWEIVGYGTHLPPKAIEKCKSSDVPEKDKKLNAKYAKSNIKTVRKNCKGDTAHSTEENSPK